MPKSKSQKKLAVLPRSLQLLLEEHLAKSQQSALLEELDRSRRRAIEQQQNYERKDKDARASLHSMQVQVRSLQKQREQLRSQLRGMEDRILKMEQRQLRPIQEAPRACEGCAGYRQQQQQLLRKNSQLEAKLLYFIQLHREESLKRESLVRELQTVKDIRETREVRETREFNSEPVREFRSREAQIAELRSTVSKLQKVREELTERLVDKMQELDMFEWRFRELRLAKAGGQHIERPSSRRGEKMFKEIKSLFRDN